MLRVRLLASSAAVLAVLATCGVTSGSAAGSASVPLSTSTPTHVPALISPDHNAADVTFAQNMIPRHAQAIATTSQAPTRAASSEVKSLAVCIERAHSQGLEQMNALLTTWRHRGGDLMGAMTATAPLAPGMMNELQMDQLATASGRGFDRTFLQMMIAHHAGAISQARGELAQGHNPEAKTLARDIVAGQQQEIAAMQVLLSRV